MGEPIAAGEVEIWTERRGEAPDVLLIAADAAVLLGALEVRGAHAAGFSMGSARREPRPRTP